ncbi:DMT family transporter [Micromonosporaceae bacterium Da 78-11]
MSKRGWLLFAVMGLIWGVPYLFIKVAVDELTPASLVLLRTALAAALLLPIAAVRGEIRPLLRFWKPLLLFTVVEIAVPWFLLSDVERHLSSSLTGLLIAAVPLVGAVLGWFTGTDRLDARRLLGLGIGLAGVAALAGLDLGAGNALALLELAIVAVGYALGPFVLTRGLAEAPRLGVISVALTLTALAYLPAGLLQMPTHWPATKVTVSVVILAVLCTAVAFLIFYALIDEVGPVRSTVITYVNPAVAVVLGVLFLDEPLTWSIALGFGLILAGSVLATRRSRPTPTPEPVAAAAQLRTAERPPASTR